MLDPPFNIITCSWPRPITQAGDQWISEPDWGAPPMSTLPQPFWTMIDDNVCWAIDWCRFFEGGLKHWGQHQNRGEMRGFHIVFHIRIKDSGKLIFWDDDGSIIRRNGKVIHADRATHPLKRSEIEVRAGDFLEIAQWQNYGGWIWGARLISSNVYHNPSSDLFLSYVDNVQQRLHQPNGPALKMYFHGGSPIRTVLALYSMILNGYRPSSVLVFGEYQWSEQSRKLFTKLLPFAQIVPTGDVLAHIRSAGGQKLAELAQRYWSVMKTCISMLYPPEEYCFMDDDVFILSPVEDALAMFREHNLVFAPDADYSRDYLATWGGQSGRHGSLRTGRINTGLYWLRNSRDPRHLAATMLRVSPSHEPAWQWDQGFLATQFADEPCFQLSTRRYFYPYFDGLPGGMVGYDYASNPCSFASIHYGGLAEKPSDMVSLMLASDILNRHISAGQRQMRRQELHNGSGRSKRTW